MTWDPAHVTYFSPHSPRPVGGRAWHAGAVISMTPSPKQGPPHKSGARRTRSPCKGGAGGGGLGAQFIEMQLGGLSCPCAVSRPVWTVLALRGEVFLARTGCPQRPHRGLCRPRLSAVWAELPGPAAPMSFSARSWAAGAEGCPGTLGRDAEACAGPPSDWHCHRRAEVTLQPPLHPRLTGGDRTRAGVEQTQCRGDGLGSAGSTGAAKAS